MKFCTLIAYVLFLPASMFAHITGTYEVSGTDPSTNQEYFGTVVIQKLDSVYTAHWSFTGGGFDTGTGVQKEDCIAFVFNENNSDSFGVQLYEIGEHSLKGPWARYGADQKGFEKLKRIDLE